MPDPQEIIQEQLRKHITVTNDQEMENIISHFRRGGKREESYIVAIDEADELLGGLTDEQKATLRQSMEVARNEDHLPFEASFTKVPEPQITKMPKKESSGRNRHNKPFMREPWE